MYLLDINPLKLLANWGFTTFIFRKKMLARRRLYELLKEYRHSIYVRSWGNSFPGCLVKDIAPVYTNADDLEIAAVGPCPMGFKLEFRVTTLNRALRYETCTVAANDLRVPDLSDDYPASFAVERYVKAVHNHLVASHATGSWVVLDDAAGNTTAALRAAGITDITVPNPNLDTLEGATLYPGLLIALVVNMPVTPKSFYLDYTCSWAGCRTCILPQVDVGIILERWLLAADGILALTVCMRHLTAEKRRTHLEDVQTDVARMGAKAGYAFERIHGSYYRNNFMAFLVLQSVPLPEKVEVLPAKRRRTAPAVFMNETHGGLNRAS